MKDIAFRKKELDTWITALTDATVIELDNAGHYPHEEASGEFIKAVKEADQ